METISANSSASPGPTGQTRLARSSRTNPTAGHLGFGDGLGDQPDPLDIRQVGRGPAHPTAGRLGFDEGLGDKPDPLDVWQVGRGAGSRGMSARPAGRPAGRASFRNCSNVGPAHGKPVSAAHFLGIGRGRPTRWTSGRSGGSFFGSLRDDAFVMIWPLPRDPEEFLAFPCTELHCESFWMGWA